MSIFLQMTRFLLLLALPIITLFAFDKAFAEEAKKRVVNMQPVKEWIDARRNLQSLSADVVQSRSLKTLRKPLIKNGRFYFKSPNHFLWEIGSNSNTGKLLIESIVLRRGEKFYLIDPENRRAQSYTLDSQKSHLLTPAQAMIEFPVGLTYSEFKEKFLLLDLIQDESRYYLKILPDDPRTHKYLREICILFDAKTQLLLSIQISFRDGSSLTNTFSNIKTNTTISDAIFNFDLKNYKIIHESN
ncbi:MAG: LolA family protein [Chthoniobacterales bacterium]